MNIIISRFMNRLKPTDNIPDEIRRAKQLVSAIDSNGIPLDPANVIRIAEYLGLEVSKKGQREETIGRIRAAIKRY